MNAKMIFLDLDGTLLNDNKEIPEINKKAIEAAVEAGHKVMVCTGRPLCSVIKLLPAFGLDKPGCYAITYNGGLIYDAGSQSTIYQKTLPLDQVKHVFEKAYEFKNIHIQTYTDHHVICEYDTKESRDYSCKIRTDRKVVHDIFEELNGQEPCKMLAIAFDTDRRQIAAFRDFMEGYCSGKIDMYFSSPEYLEFMPAGINKGHAIRWMCEYLNVPLKNTIAVGDAENDIAMLETAGFGVVMKNADHDMKKYGNYITEHDNNEGGVAEVIHKFMLDN